MSVKARTTKLPLLNIGYHALRLSAIIKVQYYMVFDTIIYTSTFIPNFITARILCLNKQVLNLIRVRIKIDPQMLLHLS